MAHIPSGTTQELELVTFRQALEAADTPSDEYDIKKWIYAPNFYSEYRYILGTRGKKPLICIGINPSTARPDALDNTLKSVERIALGNGFDSFIMFNVYAQRATSPDDMEKVCNPLLHKENLKAFRYVLSLSEHPVVWAAWGAIIEKRKYLPDLLSGRKIGAFGLTEPGAGTDASGQQTIAVKNENGDYVLNGSKCFITNGNVASTFVVFAMTDKSKGNHGITAFIVEKDFPGFSTGKHEKKMGIRGSSTCDLIFEDCIVPKENLLGKEGEGFKIAMKTLDGGRIGIASQALGLAEGAINEAVKYTKERVQFGRRLSQFQNTQFQLADMHTRTQAAQYLVYAAACKKQNHEDYSMDAAMAKLFAAETASDVTRRAVQLFGGYGYTREYPVERMMRDAKITEIYEGTSEVQRMVVAKYLGVN